MSFVPRKRRAMTLVELLVAALVLITLVVLLIVLAARAREEERLTQCRSNLRVIGLAMHMYAGDNMGYWPVWHGADQSFHGWTMTGIAADHATLYQGLGMLHRAYFRKGTEQETLLCPGPSLPRFRKAAAAYAKLFQLDPDEPFWTLPWKSTAMPFGNDNGTMDLGGDWAVPGGRDLIASTYWMRVSSGPYGAMKMGDGRRRDPQTGMRPSALVSDTILAWMPPPGMTDSSAQAASALNHDKTWNVLFEGGVVKTYHDPDAQLKQRLAEINQTDRPDYQLGAGRSSLIFDEFFDPLHQE